MVFRDDTKNKKWGCKDFTIYFFILCSIVGLYCFVKISIQRIYNYCRSNDNIEDIK